MNQNKNQQTGNPLLDYLLGNQQNPGGQTSQGLQTIMQNPQIAKAYQDRVNYYNNTNQDIAKTIDNQNQNGVNGYAVNTSPGFAGLASALPQNQAMTNSFLSNLLQAASGETNNQNSNAANVYGTQANVALGNQQLNLQKANSGWTDINGNPPTGNSTGSGNARIDNWAQSVMNGYKSIGDVPSDISPLVTKELTRRGYDPAKELWGDLNGLQGTYNQGGSLATGNNLGGKIGMGIGDLLSYIGVKTGGEQQKQLYINAAKNFANKYAGILGKGIDLPTTADTPEQAGKKFNTIAATIRNKFYQGGSAPSANNNSKDPLGLGL